MSISRRRRATVSILGSALALSFLSSICPTSATAEQRRFALEDLSRLVRVSEPDIAPDGRSIVVVVARANEDENRWDAELVLVEVAGRVERVLVRGRRGLSTPRFSPSGDRLGFLAAGRAGAGPQITGEPARADAADSAQQVFVMPMSGGEAVQVTASQRDVETFVWSPDGSQVAFVAAEPDTSPPVSGPERFNDSFEVSNDDFLTTAPPEPTQLWIVNAHASATGGEPRRLTTGPGSLTAGFGPSALSWSADGRAIAYARTSTASSGDADQSWIEIADVAGGEVRRLTGRGAFEASPAFSPDGALVAFAYPRAGDPAGVMEVQVARSARASGEATSATAPLDRSILLHRWMPGSSSLLVAANDGTRSGLWIQLREGPGAAAQARRIDLGPVAALSELSVAATGAIALVGSEALQPSELYVLDSPDAKPRRLTDFHGEIAALDLASSESLEWESEDGFRSDGVLTFPPDFDTARADLDRRWPLVVYLHGGPTASSNEAFDELAQLMAARGWVVLQPNYRGSDNRGEAHQRGIVAGAGSGPGRDVMAGVDALRRRGFVDEERIAVSGWSYGGFMTVWMLGHYPGWRAAVAGAAALDLVDMYSLSDLNVMRRHAITGSPWTGGREALYRAESPITSVAEIRAPTLILSNTGDARVAVTQSFRLFRALRDLGVETQFVAYPISGHFPSDPVRRRDVYRRWVDWIERHFAIPTTPGATR